MKSKETEMLGHSRDHEQSVALMSRPEFCEPETDCSSS